MHLYNYVKSNLVELFLSPKYFILQIWISNDPMILTFGLHQLYYPILFIWKVHFIQDYRLTKQIQLIFIHNFMPFKIQ